VTEGLGFPELLAVPLLAVGLFFLLVAVVGILRLPDFYSRLHAMGKCDTAGLVLVLVGLAILSGDLIVAIKLGFLAAFLSLANPTAIHALARAALRAGLPVWQPPNQLPRHPSDPPLNQASGAREPGR